MKFQRFSIDGATVKTVIGDNAKFMLEDPLTKETVVVTVTTQGITTTKYEPKDNKIKGTNVLMFKNL